MKYLRWGLSRSRWLTYGPAANLKIIFECSQWIKDWVQYFIGIISLNAYIAAQSPWDRKQASLTWAREIWKQVSL